MAEHETRFCKSCGEKLENPDRFCFKCGEKQSSSPVLNATITLDDFKRRKSAERSSHFKPKQTPSSSSSTRTKKDVEPKRSVTINAGIMVRNKNGYLKPVRGKKLPVKVCTDVTYERLKAACIDKHSNHDQMFCRLESYILLYPDGQEAFFLPGLSTTAFQLDLYKEELGKPYSQINMFLCTVADFEDTGHDKLDDDPKLALPGITTCDLFNDELLQDSFLNDIANTSCSSSAINILKESLVNTTAELPSVEAQQQQLLSLQHLLPTQQQPPPSTQPIILTDDDSPTFNEEQKVKEEKNLTEKLENIRRHFEDSIEDAEESICELHIRRRNIWFDTNMKLKRILKQGLRPFKVRFVGEMGYDAGGPKREFFSLIFEDAAKHVMQGGADSFTLLHDFEKLRNGDFYCLGLLTALSLVYGCTGPRLFSNILVNEILELPPTTGYINDVADYEIQEKLKILSAATDEESFERGVEDFPERFTYGVTSPQLHLADKDAIIQSIVHHWAVSSCWEEIQDFKKGLNTLGVLDVLKNHKDEAILELSKQGRRTELADVMSLFTNINYSEDAERKKAEEDIMFNFINFIEAVFNNENEAIEVIENPLDEEEEGSQTKLLFIEDFVMFCTGTKFITNSIRNCGSINFQHFEKEKVTNFDGVRLSVNTCGLLLTFPVNKRYTCSHSEFIKNLIEDVYTSPGFGKA